MHNIFMYLLYNILQREKSLQEHRLLTNRRNYRRVDEIIASLKSSDIDTACEELKKEKKISHSILFDLLNQLQIIETLVSQFFVSKQIHRRNLRSMQLRCEM